MVTHKNPCVLSQIFDEWLSKGELIDANCGRIVNATELYSGATTTMLLFNLMLLHQQQTIYKLDKHKKCYKKDHDLNSEIVDCRRN